MIGKSDAYTCHLKVVPRKTNDRRQVNSGSAAFTVWAKDTAPAPGAITAPAWPSAWAKPVGSRTLSAPGLSFGALRMPVAQRRHTYGMPTKRETTVIVHGIGNAFWHFLFVMLYITLRENQVVNMSRSFRRPARVVGPSASAFSSGARPMRGTAKPSGVERMSRSGAPRPIVPSSVAAVWS